MRKLKRICAIVFALAIMTTGSTMQFAFADEVIQKPQTEAEKATYIYLHDPDKPYQYRSPHRYGYSVGEADISEGYAPAIYRLLSGKDYKTVNLGYCCDLRTSVKEGSYYKRMNLEDARYYSTDAAKRIRSILKNGYWKEADQGTDANVPDLSGLKSAAGIPAGESLTSAEALAGTQYAVWHYANVKDNKVEKINFKLYTGTTDANYGVNAGKTFDMTSVNVDETANIKTKKNITEDHITKVYNYLIKLDGSDADSVIWNFKQEGSLITAAEADGSGNFTYNTSVKFELTGSSSDKDDLKITAEPVMKSGSKADPVAKQTVALSDLKADNGFYTITFKGLTAEQVKDIEKINFTLSGTQTVKNDVFFYEPLGGRTAAQCFVGFGEGKTAVHQEWTMAVSSNLKEKSVSLIKYDENSVVTASSDEQAAQLKAQGMIEVKEKQFVKYAFPVVGAKFQLYAKIDGIETAIGKPETTDANGEITWTTLASTDNVKYYFKELEAPKGYKLPDGNVTYDLGSDEARKYTSNCHDTGDIVISKTVTSRNEKDIDASQHFKFNIKVDMTKADAYNRLTDAEKSITSDQIKWSGISSEDKSHSDIEWNNNGDILTASVNFAHGEALKIKDLPVGAEVTVTELKADGSAVKDSEQFVYSKSLYEIKDAQQNVTVKSEVKDDENKMDFVNRKCTSIVITKTDITGDKEVAGAKLKITEKETGSVVDEWTSTNDSHVVGSELEKGKTYIITEEIAPEGYAYITTDIEFEITDDGVKVIGDNENAAVSKNENGENIGLIVKDDILHFNVNKTDLAGDEVKGAQITIYECKDDSSDEVGDAVAEWTSDGNGPHDFGQDLTAGKSYILKETQAPDGYAYITEIKFTVNKDGSITTDLKKTETANNEIVYLVEDDVTKANISKIDNTDERNYVKGAKLAIKDADGNVVEEWVTDGSSKVIEKKLIAGAKYTLEEIETPEGYKTAETIYFEVPKTAETVVLAMVDEKITASGNEDENNGDENGGEGDGNDGGNDDGSQDQDTETGDNFGDKNNGGDSDQNGTQDGDKGAVNDKTDSNISTGDKVMVGFAVVVMAGALAIALCAVFLRRRYNG